MEESRTNMQIVQELPELGRTEHAVLCYHYVDNPNDFEGAIRRGEPRVATEEESPPYCSVLCSMELDLIAYKFQDEDLIVSNLIYPNAEVCHCIIDVIFPATIIYTSEGHTYRLRSDRQQDMDGDTAPPLRCEGRLSRTYFRNSGIVVWNLALSAAEESFDEYDLIKLMHVYEGRSERTDLDEKVRFRVRATNGKSTIEVTSEELLPTVWWHLASTDFKERFAAPFARHPDDAPSETADSERQQHRLRGGRKYRSTRQPVGGTIQIAMGEELSDTGVTLKEALDTVYRARQDTGDVGPAHSASRQLEEWLVAAGGIGGVLRGLAGITNGIFDFKNVNDEEIMDTLDPTFRSGDTFLKVHRRTFINIVDEDRSLEEVRETVGISPYVILPHCVVMHNEELIDRVEYCLDAFENDKRIRHLEVLKEVSVKAMRSMYVPNLFNYATEKTLYDRAFEIRGSQAMHELNLVRIRELEQRIAQAYEKRRSRSDVVVQALLLLLTVTQVTVIFMPEADIPQAGMREAALVGSLLLMMGIFFIVLGRR